MKDRLPVFDDRHTIVNLCHHAERHLSWFLTDTGMPDFATTVRDEFGNRTRVWTACILATGSAKRANLRLTPGHREEFLDVIRQGDKVGLLVAISGTKDIFSVRLSKEAFLGPINIPALIDRGEALALIPERNGNFALALESALVFIARGDGMPAYAIDRPPPA